MIFIRKVIYKKFKRTPHTAPFSDIVPDFDPQGKIHRNCSRTLANGGLLSGHIKIPRPFRNGGGSKGNVKDGNEALCRVRKLSYKLAKLARLAWLTLPASISWQVLTAAFCFLTLSCVPMYLNPQSTANYKSEAVL